MIRFHIVSIFPDTVRAYCEASILCRAQKSGHIAVAYADPRAYVQNKWGKVDDRPYGGGPGMVMAVEPLVHALDTLLKSITRRKNTTTKIIIFSPSGKQFTNAYAQVLVKKYTDIILIAGRYEGIDARVKKIISAKKKFASGGKISVEEVSAGPFVLTGGEVPAMIVVDACARHIDGVLGKTESREEERIASPEVYTRPEIYVWKGKKYSVPKILLSGDTKKIEQWKTDKLSRKKRN